MKGLEILARVLEASVKRRGEVPLTNAHLLNMIRMVQRAENKQQEITEAMLNEALGEDKKWGSNG